MPGRRLIALVIVSVLACSTATAGAAATIKPLPGGYGAHCGTGAQNRSCQDVVDDVAATKPTFSFQPNKTYCSTRQLQKGERGTAFNFAVGLHFKHGRFTQKYTYEDHQREGNPGSVDVAFTITGQFTSRTTLRVVIRGKVIAALPIAADCANVSFTEVHVLKHIRL